MAGHDNLRERLDRIDEAKAAAAEWLKDRTPFDPVGILHARFASR